YRRSLFSSGVCRSISLGASGYCRCRQTEWERLHGDRPACQRIGRLSFDSGMIFRRYLLRELFSAWMLWMMVLTLALISIVAAKTFNQIDIRSLDWVVWGRLFCINGLRYLPYL